ncbi:MAG: hypothetical protein Athens041674_328 [Parcubacteria group bacterium Athens0416_74]|nr:MAG: hypothetical protein Athens041674_328 [Parcubacteria group bacterium Athens0416_74]
MVGGGPEVPLKAAATREGPPAMTRGTPFIEPGQLGKLTSEVVLAIPKAASQYDPSTLLASFEGNNRLFEELLDEAFATLVMQSSEVGSNEKSKLLRRLSSVTIRASGEFNALEHYADGKVIEGRRIRVADTLTKDFRGVVEPATGQRFVMCVRTRRSVQPGGILAMLGGERAFLTLAQLHEIIRAGSAGLKFYDTPEHLRPAGIQMLWKPENNYAFVRSPVDGAPRLFGWWVDAQHLRGREEMLDVAKLHISYQAFSLHRPLRHPIPQHSIIFA